MDISTKFGPHGYGFGPHGFGPLGKKIKNKKKHK